MTGWDREYKLYKHQYQELFDNVMQREQESNIEFLEKSLSKMTGRNVVACANGTDALYFSLLSLGVGKGDEVLTTAFSWISTASVITMAGATPIFCDINILDYHMSFDSIKRMYSDKVKAIIYPHLFGNMSDISKIKGPLFTSKEEVRVYMITNATNTIDKMVKKATEIVDVVFEDRNVQEEIIEANNVQKVQNEESNNIIKVDLGNGTVGKINTKNLENVGETT